MQPENAVFESFGRRARSETSRMDEEQLLRVRVFLEKKDDDLMEISEGILVAEDLINPMKPWSLDRKGFPIWRSILMAKLSEYLSSENRMSRTSATIGVKKVELRRAMALGQKVIEEGDLRDHEPRLYEDTVGRIPQIEYALSRLD